MTITQVSASLFATVVGNGRGAVCRAPCCRHPLCTARRVAPLARLSLPMSLAHPSQHAPSQSHDDKCAATMHSGHLQHVVSLLLSLTRHHCAQIDRNRLTSEFQGAQIPPRSRSTTHSSLFPLRMHRALALTAASTTLAHISSRTLLLLLLPSSRRLTMSTPLSSSAAVTRQRSFGLALLASVPVVGIQEGSSAISIKEEGVVKAAVATAATSADEGSTLPDSLSQVSAVAAGRPRR